MRGEAMPQRVRMNRFPETRTLSCLLASMPNSFRIDGPIPAMAVITRKEPDTRLSPQPPPVFPEFLEQLGAQHHVAILASLPALDVNHHALAVDVANFQVRQFGTAHSGSVERHQQGAMVGSAGGINQCGYLFLAENRRQVNGLLVIGGLGDAPGRLKRLDVEKTQRRQALRDRAGRFPLLEQLRLIFANVSRA